MNKKVIVISLIIIVICAIIMGVIIFIGNDELKETSSQPINQVSQNIEEDIVNMVQENIVNEIESENVVENTQVNTMETVDSNNQTELLPEEPKKAEEKAVEIVKKDWGEDSSVKFQVETMDANGDYVVSVRDITTTEAKAFYTVNTTTGKFSK